MAPGNLEILDSLSQFPLFPALPAQPASHEDRLAKRHNRCASDVVLILGQVLTLAKDVEPFGQRMRNRHAEHEVGRRVED